MKNYNSAVLMTVALLSGYLSLGKPASADMAPEQEKEILYWVAPMDPNYRRDQPGKSPMGMDLIPYY